MSELIKNENQKEKFEMVLSNDRLIEITQRAEQRIDAVIQMKRVALKVTNYNDWVDESGKPYLTVSGSEKVARLFGVSWTIDEPNYEEDQSGHYTYTYTGIFSFEGVSIQAIGTRSSKAPFFSRSYGKDVPPSEIDKTNVKKAAYTNLLGNGITRLLGIRNLTYDDLEIVGITKDMITNIQYGKKKEKKPPLKQPQKSTRGGQTSTSVDDHPEKDTLPQKKTWPSKKVFIADIKSYEERLGLDVYADILSQHEINPDELNRLESEKGGALYDALEEAYQRVKTTE